MKWDCLIIGALGTGQIQIANSKHIEIPPSQQRRAWMLEFCDTMLGWVRAARATGCPMLCCVTRKSTWDLREGVSCA